MEIIDNKDAELSEPITKALNHEGPRISCTDIKSDTELGEKDASRHDQLHEQNKTLGSSDPVAAVNNRQTSLVCSIL